MEQRPGCERSMLGFLGSTFVKVTVEKLVTFYGTSTVAFRFIFIV